MANNNDMARLIKRLETELYDLKVAANLSPNIKTYVATINVTNWLVDEYHEGAVVDIEYDDGENDIISLFSFGGTATGQNPSNNKQRVSLYNQYAGGTLTVVSTRPIKSITNPEQW